MFVEIRKIAAWFCVKKCSVSLFDNSVGCQAFMCLFGIIIHKLSDDTILNTKNIINERFCRHIVFISVEQNVFVVMKIILDSFYQWIPF